MTPDDIELLWRFKGGHSLARMAAHPGQGFSSWRQSMHGSYSWPVQIDTKPDGIHVTDRESGDHRVITWASIKAHVLAHVTDETRDWIRALDSEWCRVKSMPDVPPGQYRYFTEQEEQRIASCERWLDHLARTVWDPALVTPATPEPEQLDMLAYLEEMTS